MRFWGLICLSILLMVCDQHQQPLLQRLRMGLSLVTTPIIWLVNAPSELVDWTSETLVTRRLLLSENQVLRQKQLALQAKLQTLLALERENTQLRALLHSAPKASQHVLAAQLLALNQTPFTQQVLINRGSHDKVFLGQPVVDAFGVMGQIVKVSPFVSSLMLLTDPRSAIPVQDNRNGLRAMAVGEGRPNTLSLIHVPLTADIKVGDVLVSSGLGRRYPKGYPVGTVDEISRDPGLGFARVNVRALARFNRSRQVLLVWPL